MGTIALYLASAIVFFWGVAHIVIPTKSIVESFGPISTTNRRVLLMEWLMEGLLLMFIGALVALVAAFAQTSDPTAKLVFWSSSTVLIVMAAISALTGARTDILPMRLCPAIFVVAAILIGAGAAM